MGGHIHMQTSWPNIMSRPSLKSKRESVLQHDLCTKFLYTVGICAKGLIRPFIDQCLSLYISTGKSLLSNTTQTFISFLFYSSDIEQFTYISD